MLKALDHHIRELNHKRIDTMRAWKLALAQFLFPVFSTKTKKEIEKGDLLVFRLDDKLGDSITSTGFLYQLKKNFPENRLVVLSGKNAAFIYRKLSFIDDVIVVKKGILQTLRAYLILKSRKYRFIFNTSHILTPQVIFLSSFLKVWKKVTFLNPQAKSFTDHVKYNELTDHVTVRYQKSLEAVGVETQDLDYHMVSFDEDSRRAVDKAVSELRRKAPMIVLLNSFAGARLRNLNQETTTAIVRGILEKYKNVVVLSVGSQDDLQKIQTWVKAFGDFRWMCYARQGTLGFNFAIAQHSALIISPDTAWIHVASALKKPVVAIYREDEVREKNSLIWAPYKTKNAVVYAPFDQKRPHDINSVDVNQVVDAVGELLEDFN